MLFVSLCIKILSFVHRVYFNQLETLEVTKSSQESTKASISETVARLNEELAEKDEYIKALEEKGQEVLCF
jgi:uncharacterized coiled-coil protein SlyX